MIETGMGNHPRFCLVTLPLEVPDPQGSTGPPSARLM